jgi:RimJ/RimL family protein N-acetyltransferase
MIQTTRLCLRRWVEGDREPFAALNSDSRVMEFMPGCLSRVESDLLLDRLERQFDERGFGLYAAELREQHLFVGFAGLSIPNFEAHFTPCVEIGWRLNTDSWGRGLATEAAKAIVEVAFGPMQIEALVSFTVPTNVRSRRVMEKIGMRHDPADDFDHPNLLQDHPLRRHVLYRIHRSEWTGEKR